MLERGRSVVVCAVLFLLMMAVAPKAHALAVLDFDTYGGHDYYLLDLATWLDAEAAAIELGGHLATIDDDAENTFVAGRFGALTEGRNLWIGLTDQAVEGTFVWTSGTPVSFTNWLGGEPNDCTFVGCFTEDFVAIAAFGFGTNGKWFDVPSDIVLWSGVVEVVPVPEPSSLLLFGLGASALVGAALRRR